MPVGLASRSPCPTSGRGCIPLPVVAAMRGAGGMREPGLGVSRFAAAPVTCPWGCVLGPGGWSGAPFCPRHCSPNFRNAGGRAPGVGNIPSEEEEEKEDQWWWMRDREYWDFPREDGTDTPPGRTSPSALELKLRWLPRPWGQKPTPEEAERNAQELMEEEERVKRKAEKKKMKKKRQKDRKKQEKLGQEQKNELEREANTLSTRSSGCPQGKQNEEGETQPGPPSQGGSAASSGEEGEGQEAEAEEMEEELDLSCTFVSKARQKAGVRLPTPRGGRPSRTPAVEPGRKAAGKVPESPPPAPQVPGSLPVPPDPSMVELSLVLAGSGLEAAQRGLYDKAVEAFTEALSLNPCEHRLLGNRSYCYERLGRYQEALEDAREAVRLQPGWPKGWFRQGKALRGLQRYAEAAAAFLELLRWDATNTEAATQLAACRALLQSSPGGVPVSLSLPEAREPPMPTPGPWASRSHQGIDESSFVTVGGGTRSPARPPGQAVASDHQTLPPSHPARDCYPLWVGNITPRINETVLRRAFSRFGEISFIRMLPRRRCAFLNYTRKEGAEAAYAALQDTELEGIKLVLQLKHPSHATPSPHWHPELL
ncbi:tetratricopeptide repeat protein 31 isoform X2 [Heliangelus exortis]|uniref:tetratricopeptide repeat protein 31 isoform X2 n=1 Tax=Heliangelus exortis TaxID=472823 RepID=UPI003A92B170